MAAHADTSERACAQCGANTTKPKYCSRRCNMAAFWARHPEKKKASYKPKPPKPPRSCRCGATLPKGRFACDDCKRASRLALGIAHYRKARGDVRCSGCGIEIANDGSYQRRCPTCRDDRAASVRRASRQVRKHRERAATVERFDPLEVLERDGWKCHICRRKTPKSKRGTYAPNAPELDHIVPLAKGGEHSRANTACACRRCNIEKSDRIIGQPSLLAA